MHGARHMLPSGTTAQQPFMLTANSVLVMHGMPENLTRVHRKGIVIAAAPWSTGNRKQPMLPPRSQPISSLSM